MKINVLPEEIANMISAGEVVERPASAIKELAENSIDAGAKNITVEIKNGGMTYMRVTDDGCGIEPDEVCTAFLRHATSKIKTENDLNSIYTLGFRGEALASIAAVAKVDVFTKTRDSQMGVNVSIEGGTVTEKSEAGCPDGTTIVVKNLFYNTPARMKFLKSDSTEAAYVSDVINKIILSRPEIKIKLINNGKTVVSSSGDGKLLTSVYTVYGKELSDNMLPVDYQSDGIRVSGYCGNASAARKDRRRQIFFINGRCVNGKILSGALSEAYRNSVMAGKFPSAVLNIDVSAAFVDVNVHPTKSEVRFSDDKKVYSAIYWAVKNALAEKKYVPEITFNTSGKTDNVKANETFDSKEFINDSKPENTVKEPKFVPVSDKGFNSPERNSASDINMLRDSFIKSPSERETVSEVKPYEHIEHIELKKTASETAEEIAPQKDGGDLFEERFAKGDAFAANKINPACAVLDKDEITEDKKQQNNETEKSEKEEKEEKVQQTIDIKTNSFKVAGQIFDTYIIAEKDGEMLLIDQHAAHERIYFEQFVKDFENRNIQPQVLLIPSVVRLDPISFDSAVQNTEFFKQLGFEIEPFGQNTLAVRMIPYIMDEDTVCDTVTEICELISQKKESVSKELYENALHTMACKRAVKGKSELSAVEMESLVKRVLEFGDINTCPHGRPIMIKMTKYQLEKQFKRIV